MIPIVLASDDNYAIPMCVTISSIFQHALPETKYDIHLLLSDTISQKTFEYIHALTEENPRHTISLHDMRNQYQNEDMHISHTSYATYYRLQLPSLLSDYDKCIYLDVDTCVCVDLTDLYQTNMSDYYIAGVIAAGYLYPEENVQKKTAELEIDNLEAYINAGVLLMNLRKMRNDHMDDVFQKLMARKYTSQDQDILNKACYGHIRILHPRYNAMTKYELLNDHAYTELTCLPKAYSENDWNNARLSPAIIHYADRIKPWNQFDACYADVWWNTARQLPFFLDVYDKYAESAMKNIPNSQVLSRRLKEAYVEKSALNAKLQTTYREKSELNAKLQITYQEKAERGLRIKELESRLNRAERELEQIKSRKAYSILKKLNRI